MEYFKQIFQRYCSPEREQAEEEIKGLIRCRNIPELRQMLHTILDGVLQVLVKDFHECKKVAEAFLLLQFIADLDAGDVAGLWGTVKNKARFFDYDNDLNHDTKQFSCTWCNLVKSGAAYIETVYVKVQAAKKSYEPPPPVFQHVNCSTCNKPGKIIKRPCGHLLCKTCWKDILKNVNKYQIPTIACPVDQEIVTGSWIQSKNKKDFKELKPEAKYPVSAPESKRPSHLQRQQVSKETVGYYDTPGTAIKTCKIDCPKCQKPCILDPHDIILTAMGTCDKCDTFFCTRCFNDFHGVLACPEEMESSTNQLDGGVDVLALAPAQHKPPRSPSPPSSAIAKPFELDFYTEKEGKEKTFSAEDIQLAFADPQPETPVRNCWPWDSHNPHALIYSPRKFESLRMGNWVQDELLENCVKLLIRQQGLEDKFTLLESFVINWSMRKDQADSELLKLLHDKRVFEKEVVLTLINTDLGGIGGHWILCAVNIQKKIILLQDTSLVLSPTYYQKYFFAQLRILHLAATASHLRKTHEFKENDWKLVVSLDTVQQRNAYDCGPLSVCNALGVMCNLQVASLPDGGKVRGWIYRCLDESGKPESRHDSTENTDFSHKNCETFMPAGLKIHFECFANKKLF